MQPEARSHKPQARSQKPKEPKAKSQPKARSQKPKASQKKMPEKMPLLFELCVSCGTCGTCGTRGTCGLYATCLCSHLRSSTSTQSSCCESSAALTAWEVVSAELSRCTGDFASNQMTLHPKCQDKNTQMISR